MKKTVSLLIAAIVAVTAILHISARVEYDSLLLLGDSITYGYGLDGGKNSPDNYGVLLRDHLGISNTGFKNAAVNGDTSANLLALLPSIEDDIAAADLVVVSIGGNDLLGLLWGAVAEVSGPGWRFDDVMSGLTDPDYISKLADLITIEKITGAVVDYTVNLAEIISRIKTLSPDAHLIFLAQYNPISGAAGLEMFNAIVSASVTLLNAAMQSTISVNGGDYIDIYSEFEGRGPELTFITTGDIHPNAAGHKLIFELISKHLENKAAEQNGSPVTETPRSEDTGTGKDTGPAAHNLTGEIAGEETQPTGAGQPRDTVVTVAETTKSPVNNRKKHRGCRSSAAYPAIIFLVAAAGVPAACLRRKKDN